MNLLTSFADEFEEGEDDDEAKNGEIDQLDDDLNNNWVTEYKKGCDWEIYTTELSEMFVGWKFSTLSEYLYNKLGIVLFGLQVEDLKLSKGARTLLNPAGITSASHTHPQPPHTYTYVHTHYLLYYTSFTSAVL